MPSFGYDLRYIQAGSQAIESFLLSKDIYWPIGAHPPAGEPPYPLLSLGGLLLAERRAQAHTADPMLQSELNQALQPVRLAQQKWPVAWENKASAEASARIHQWRNYLDDYRRSPADHYNRYSYEVFRRVIVDLLHPDFPPSKSADVDLLQNLDHLLHELLLPGGFTWEAMYEDVFPAVSFWYLFGRLPGQSGKQAFE